MKRFAKAVLFGLIALSALSCAKKKGPIPRFNEGVGYCENTKLGTFNVTLEASQQYLGLYNMKIDTLTAVSEGQYVTVAITNEKLTYEQLESAVPMRSGKTLHTGLVSPVQLQTYNTLIILPYTSAKSTLIDGVSDNNEALCEIPTSDTTTTQSNGTQAN